MKCFINGAPGSCLTDRSELKAVLVALVACLLFIGFLTISATSRNRRQVVKNRSYRPPQAPVKPPPPPQVLTEVPPSPPDLNTRFRYVPQNFKGIDFKDHSYGNYTLSDGKTVDLVLINGQFRHYGASSHWFDLNDVFYTDLTDDGSPEAIAMLTHLECGRSCDGGKNLIYIYSLNAGSFKEIFNYETGSGLNGCSLKSLIVKNKHLSLELFGKCPQPAWISSSPPRRATYDLTRVDFRFNGKELVERKKTHFTLPDCGEVNYGAKVLISDRQSPVEVTTLAPCNNIVGTVNVD